MTDSVVIVNDIYYHFFGYLTLSVIFYVNLVVNFAFSSRQQVMQQSPLMQTYMDCKLDLLRFLSNRTGSSSLAADLLHDLYLKLRQLGDSNTIGNSRSYLYSMAANLATDHLRIENRRQEILEEGKGVIWKDADNLSPESHTMAYVELDFLAQEIAKLEPRCRKVFYLSRYKGKSQSDIAAELGIGVSTVYKDLKLAMTILLEARRRFNANSTANHHD